MTKIFLYLILLGMLLGLSAFSCKSQSAKRKSIKKAFMQIDSIVNANRNDTIFYCSPYLIKKVESITKLNATDKGGSYVGKLFFTKTDYDKWTKWRKQKYKE